MSVPTDRSSQVTIASDDPAIIVREAISPDNDYWKPVEKQKEFAPATNGNSFETDALDFEAITSSVPMLERQILPNKLEQYLSLTAQQFGVNYSAAFACFIGNAAFALGGNKWIRIEDERTDRAILWNALIGKSGDGKTPLMMETGGKYFNDLHNLWDVEYQDELSNCDIEGEKPHLKRLLSNSLSLQKHSGNWNIQ